MYAINGKIMSREEFLAATQPAQKKAKAEAAPQPKPKAAKRKKAAKKR